AVVPTGIALGLPPGVAALTLPRSGLAARHAITIVNAPGLIGPGYRGEIQVILLNTDRDEPFTVHAGDRIAQLLLVGLLDAALLEVAELEVTPRGTHGFGSSGTAALPSSERLRTDPCVSWAKLLKVPMDGNAATFRSRRDRRCGPPACSSATRACCWCGSAGSTATTGCC